MTLCPLTIEACAKVAEEYWPSGKMKHTGTRLGIAARIRSLATNEIHSSDALQGASFGRAESAVGKIPSEALPLRVWDDREQRMVPLQQDCAPAGAGLTAEEQQIVNWSREKASDADVIPPGWVAVLIAIIDRLSDSAPSEEELAAQVHLGRFLDVARYPFDREDKGGQEYCRRIARALLSQFNITKRGE